MSGNTSRVPECPLCHGTGWRPLSLDRTVPTVTRCDCRLADRSARLLAQAEIPAQYGHCTLDSLDTKSNAPLRNALVYARKFVEEYPLRKGQAGMLLYGDCGTGKTHLAAAILRELVLQRAARGLFRGYSALLKQIQATYSRQALADEETGVVLTEYSILQDVIQADVLVLDDLGAEKSSEWTLSLLYHVINERYNTQSTTIITTNLPWDAPDVPPQSRRRSQQQKDAEDAMKTPTLRARISERTYSRIAEMCPHKIELQGLDYRKFKGGAQEN